MAGKTTGDRYHPLDRALTCLVAVIGALVIVFIAMSMLEATLKRIDRQNQEQITWTCNGNGGIDSCLPYANV